MEGMRQIIFELSFNLLPCFLMTSAKSRPSSYILFPVVGETSKAEGELGLALALPPAANVTLGKTLSLDLVFLTHSMRAENICPTRIYWFVVMIE